MAVDEDQGPPLDHWDHGVSDAPARYPGKWDDSMIAGMCVRERGAAVVKMPGLVGTLGPTAE